MFEIEGIINHEIPVVKRCGRVPVRIPVPVTGYRGYKYQVRSVTNYTGYQVPGTVPVPGTRYLYRYRYEMRVHNNNKTVPVLVPKYLVPTVPGTWAWYNLGTEYPVINYMKPLFLQLFYILIALL